MSRAEKFIQDCTRNCSNEFEPQKAPPSVYNPWLTPDQARRAVEIIKEETIEKVCEWMNEKLPIYISYCKRGTSESVKEFINDLKQAIKDE